MPPSINWRHFFMISINKNVNNNLYKYNFISIILAFLIIIVNANFIRSR